MTNGKSKLFGSKILIRQIFFKQSTMKVLEEEYLSNLYVKIDLSRFTNCDFEYPFCNWL